jgi:hypothetical protein
VAGGVRERGTLLHSIRRILKEGGMKQVGMPIKVPVCLARQATFFSTVGQLRSPPEWRIGSSARYIPC